MKALLIIFVCKKYYNFKITNAGKCVTNGGEYSAVLRARRKKCHFVNKLCEGKCTRILKSYTLAEQRRLETIRDMETFTNINICFPFHTFYSEYAVILNSLKTNSFVVRYVL